MKNNNYLIITHQPNELEKKDKEWKQLHCAASLETQRHVGGWHIQSIDNAVIGKTGKRGKNFFVPKNKKTLMTGPDINFFNLKF